MNAAHLTSAATGARIVSAPLQALFALALGVFLVGMMGLAHSSAIHDAAHDVRHSIGFPCH